MAAIRVEPAAFTLLSEVEKHGALQHCRNYPGVTGGGTSLHYSRPIDLDIYIADLEAQMEDVDGSRKNVLRGYVNYVRRLAANAEALERRFYLLMPGERRRRKEHKMDYYNEQGNW